MTGFIKKMVISTCIMFTVFMLVGTLAAIPFIGLQYGLKMTLTLLLAAAAFAVLRGIWFTDKVIRRLSYPLRIFGFGITSFILLVFCAWIGDWFPMDNPWAWVTFSAIFLVTLVIFCIAYQVYFKRTVGNFDAALRQYHERMGR